jgi:GGDEF domain-containing protein
MVGDIACVAVLMLDIDHFKLFNDTFGHQAGDTVLRALGELVRWGTRGQDIACRFGGEEFVIILTSASVDAACKRAEKLREELKELKGGTRRPNFGHHHFFYWYLSFSQFTPRLRTNCFVPPTELSIMRSVKAATEWSWDSDAF